jgi:hypothetical protein
MAIGNDAGAIRMKIKTKYTLIMIALTLAVLLTIFELFSFFIINRTNFYLPHSSERAEPGPATAALFNHDLGWEPRHPNSHGYRGKPKNIETAAVSLFGDSFTRGHTKIARSWAHLLELEIGRPVLNFAVGGYGTDQAFLRFQKRYLHKIETPYVILGVMSENIARIVNRYRGFYMRRSNFYFTKPRFDLDHGGNLLLLPNPVGTREEIALLENYDFLRGTGAEDYWYGFFEEYDLNRTAGFPYSFYLVKALPYYLRYYYNLISEDRMDYFDLYEDPHVCTILEEIIFSFIRQAEESGAVPLILFFPNSLDMINHENNGETVYRGFYRNIRGRHDLTFDALDYFIPHLEQGATIESFFRSRSDGHYSAAGEGIVATGIHANLLSADSERQLLNRNPGTGHGK